MYHTCLSFAFPLCSMCSVFCVLYISLLTPHPQNKREVPAKTSLSPSSPITRKLPSLAKVMLGLENCEQRQQALSYIMKAMEVHTQEE